MKKISKCITSFFVILILSGLGYGIYYNFVKYPNYAIEDGIEYSPEVFVNGENDYNTFRIPAILYNPETSTLFAFCEGRKNSGSDFGNIDMLMKRSFNGGQTWEPMQIVWDYNEIAVQNPCPVYVSATHTIILHLYVNRTDHYVIKSSDNGVSWGIPQNIGIKPPNTVYSGPAAGHGTIISTGRILIPGMHIFEGSAMQEDTDRVWGSHIVYSDDNGQTWQLGNVYPPNSNECMLTETINGSVIMMLRPNNTTETYHYNYVSYSNDGGITSSEPKLHPELISPICQVSIIPFRGETTTTTDDLLLYSGPDSQTERVKMTIKISQDNGQTWNQSCLLFKGKSGYSDLVVLNYTHVGCLFENGRFGYHDQLSFVVCNINWLRGN